MACSTCAGRYRVQSESSRQRKERRARKILSKVVFNDNHPDGRIPYRKHRINTELREKAMWASNVIVSRDEALIGVIRKVDQQ